MQIHWEDGVAAWFAGPEWDDVAEESFQHFESEIENTGRANATWEDDTGAARAGLTARTVNNDGIISMVFYHTAAHGFWLEVIQSGRFAILERTLTEYWAPMMDVTIPKIRNARKGRSV
jgi:hypothetical protein